MDNNLLERIARLEARIAHQQETIDFLLDYTGYGSARWAQDYDQRGEPDDVGTVRVPDGDNPILQRRVA